MASAAIPFPSGAVTSVNVELCRAGNSEKQSQLNRTDSLNAAECENV